MAAASTFSYAQAAKGQGTTTQTSTSSPDSQPENATVVPAADKPAEAQSTTTETSQQDSKTDTPSISLEKQDVESVSGVDSESRTESVQDRRSEPRRDDDAGRLERPWRRNDKGTRSSSATTRSVDEQDSRRPRKGKKGKSSDKQASEGPTAPADQEQKEEPEAPKIELAEAPIPTVNIWQQRKQAAQQAKAQPEPATNGDSESAQEERAATKPTSNVNVTPALVNGGGKPHRANEKPERNGTRGNRLAGRENREGKSEIPPPVDDAASWPTPETAIKEEKKKPAEKVERVENTPDESAQAKPRQKKEWVTYDYVPSVNFETQLPQMRSSKPRGGAKGANGSRAAAGTQGGDKAAATAALKNESRDRPREASNGTSRTPSMPPTNKRASMDVANARGEQRRPAQNAGAEKAKDAGAGQADHQPSTREGRSERGRGGFRGRGGHHGMNSHAQHQHSASSAAAPSFQPNAPASSRAQGPYSPPPRQGHGQMFMPPPQRGGRGGRNGGSYHRMSLPNGSSRLPPAQTQFGAYDYQMQPITPAPFQQTSSYWDGMVVNMLRQQLEYYFSIENLCKDMYMRKRMDSQGFVPLMMVAAFKRMRELCPDIVVLRTVCEESNEVDYVVGEDECERLRRRDGWDKFILPMEDRDDLARNHGPVQLIYKSRSYGFSGQYNGMAPSPYGGVASPPAYTSQANPGFPAEHHGVNGVVNDHGNATQLSANVPDFAPSQPVGETGDVVNGHAPAAAVNGLTNGIHSEDAGQS
ncbi:hypothetical protein ACO1O0_000335 [Amphichorda felina]